MTEYVKEWPRAWLGSVTLRCYLWSGSQSSNSPWSGRRNVYGPHRQLWRVEMQLAPKLPELWKPIGAFFSEIGGQAGLIRTAIPTRLKPQYTLAATLGNEPFSDDTSFTDNTGFVTGGLPAFIHVAQAAARGSKKFVAGGLPENLSNALLPGDLFEIRRDGIADEIPSMHEVMRRSNTDADGKTLLEFRPGLRKGVQAGDQIALEYPTCVFRAIDDEQGIIDVDVAWHGRAGFTLIEAVP